MRFRLSFDDSGSIDKIMLGDQAILELKQISTINLVVAPDLIEMLNIAFIPGHEKQAIVSLAKSAHSNRATC